MEMYVIICEEGFPLGVYSSIEELEAAKQEIAQECDSSWDDIKDEYNIYYCEVNTTIHSASDAIMVANR